MQLDYAFLANEAGYLEDKRLSVFGGGIDRVEVDGFPVVIKLHIVARLLLFPEEPLQGHLVWVDVTGPRGERRSSSSKSRLETLRNATFPDRPSGATIVTQLILGANEPGEYTLHVMADGTTLKTLSLVVANANATGPYPNVN